jgi:hypothetical protein
MGKSHFNVSQVSPSPASFNKNEYNGDDFALDMSAPAGGGQEAKA